jgi:two-component system CheB/CheR fusion protein
LSGERPIQVLIIDDDDDIRAMIELVLQLDGIASIGMAGGQEALDWLECAAQLPSLIVLDLMMRTMSGWEFRAAQLRHPRLAGIPVVIFSGGSDVAAQAEQLRALASFRKPANLEDLLQIVRRVLGSPVRAA